MASRLVERTGRPVIVVTIDEHGEGKGSGRSVQGFNLHACIGSCADLLVRYGGHAMAAGLSVREENLPELRRRLNEWAARECPVLHTPPLTCDVTIHLDRITVESVRHLDQLAPYGAENPTPVFLLQSAVVDGVYPVSEGLMEGLSLQVRDTVEGETPAAAATSLMVTAMICSSRIDIASIVKPFARNVNVCAKSCANRAMRHSAYLRQLSQRILCLVVENVESLFLP